MSNAMRYSFIGCAARSTCVRDRNDFPKGPILIATLSSTRRACRTEGCLIVSYFLGVHTRCVSIALSCIPTTMSSCTRQAKQVASYHNTHTLELDIFITRKHGAECKPMLTFKIVFRQCLPSRWKCLDFIRFVSAVFPERGTASKRV